MRSERHEKDMSNHHASTEEGVHHTVCVVLHRTLYGIAAGIVVAFEECSTDSLSTVDLTGGEDDCEGWHWCVVVGRGATAAAAGKTVLEYGMEVSVGEEVGRLS